MFKSEFGLILGWWNLCYLDRNDIDKYLIGAQLSLVENGCIILAEPISKQNRVNNYNGQSMGMRTSKFYEDIF
jgi:hypothetical protein